MLPGSLRLWSRWVCALALLGVCACDGPFVSLGRFQLDPQDGAKPTSGADAGEDQGPVDPRPQDGGAGDAGLVMTDAGDGDGSGDASLAAGMDAGTNIASDGGADAAQPDDAGGDEVEAGAPGDGGPGMDGSTANDAGTIDAGGMDAGANDAGAIDAGTDAGGTDSGAPDAGDPFAGVTGCLVGEPGHLTIQSALDDVSCATVLVPAGTWHEQLTISRVVQVVGEARATTIVDAQQAGRALVVTTNGVGTVRELTFTGGENSNGGGIYNGGALTLAAVDVINNRAPSTAGRGAGITTVAADLTLTEGTRIAGNRLAPGPGGLVNGLGGGIYAAGACTVTLGDGVIIEDNGLDSAVTDGNTVSLYGGGIALDTGVTLQSTGSGVAIRNNLLRLEDQSTNMSNHKVYGGAVYCQNATVRLNAGDRLEGNRLAVTTAGALGHTYGGAIAAIGCGPVHLGDAIAQDNRAETFSRHIGTAYGGAIYLERSNLLMERSYVGFNQATADYIPGDTQLQDARGGAIALVASLATISDSTFESNAVLATGPITTLAWGGAIAAYAANDLDANTLRLTRDTLFDNLASANAVALSGEAAGGGLYLASFGSDEAVDAELVNCTLSANVVEAHGTATLSARGGAVHASDNVTATGVRLAIYNGTIVQNVALGDGQNLGGGISLDRTNTYDPVIALYNSILAANAGDVSHEDFACTGSSGTVQLIGGAIHGTALNQGGCATPTSGAGSFLNLPAYAPSPLLDNGGATLTHALSPTDPAIGSGTPTGCDGPGASLLATDQRELLRTGACDLGSVKGD